MIKYSLHWHMKFQEHLTFIFQNLYLWDGYNFCHPSLWRNEVTLGKWKLWTLFDTHIHCFFLCAEIYATSHIIILFKAFPTRLPYQDIENRTYLNVLYEYLSANLPTLKHYTLGKNYISTHALRAEVCRTSVVSSNEYRFVKRVSLRQTSLVLTNETRFDKRDSFWFSDKRVSLEIVYRRTLKSWRLKIEWFPRNHEIQSNDSSQLMSTRYTGSRFARHFRGSLS